MSESYRLQAEEKIVRYVIAHQMQANASIIPDGVIILEIGVSLISKVVDTEKRTTIIFIG